MKVGLPDGLDLAVHEAGRGDGRPCLLLHGYSGSAATWASTAPALAPRFRVMSVDFRGHGTSGRTEDVRDYTLEQLTDDIVALADNLELKRFTLVGHGMGGDVAQLLALEHPDRLEAMVLVTTGPGPLDPSSGWAKGRAYVAQTIAAQGLAAGWQRYLESGVVGWNVDELPDEIAAEWRKEFMRTAPEAFVGLERSMSTQTDRAKALGTLTTPTLVVAGAQDAAFLVESKRLADAIPDAELVVIEDAGHSPHVSKAEEFNDILLAFLKRAVPAGRT